MSNKLIKNNMEKNVDNSNNEKEQQIIKCIMYKEEDINLIIQMLLRSKVDYDNLELFYTLKKVLLNPIPFEVDKE